MKLKLVYDTDTEIPEAHRELFEERDGKWYFAGIDGGFKTQKDVDAVQTALSKERKDHTETKAKVKKFEKLADKDPEDLLRAVDRVAELEQQIADAEAASGAGVKGEELVKARVEAARAAEKKLHERTIGDLQKKLLEKDTEVATERNRSTELDGRIRNAAIERSLTEAASKHKVESVALPDVLNYRHLFETEDQADGSIVVKTKDNVGTTPGLDPASWLTDQKATRPHWWPASVGGGARGSGGNGVGGGENPFSKSAPNLDKAMQVMKADPTKAQALAKLAGHADVNAAVAAMGRSAASGKPMA